MTDFDFDFGDAMIGLNRFDGWFTDAIQMLDFRFGKVLPPISVPAPVLEPQAPSTPPLDVPMDGEGQVPEVGLQPLHSTHTFACPRVWLDALRKVLGRDHFMGSWKELQDARRSHQVTLGYGSDCSGVDSPAVALKCILEFVEDCNCGVNHMCVVSLI